MSKVNYFPVTVSDFLNDFTRDFRFNSDFHFYVAAIFVGDTYGKKLSLELDGLFEQKNFNYLLYAGHGKPKTILKILLVGLVGDFPKGHQEFFAQMLLIFIEHSVLTFRFSRVNET